MGVLDKLIDLLVLLPDDAEKMRRRGFTDVVIEKKRWRSCCPSNAQVLKHLEQEYGVDELIKERLYYVDSLGHKTPNNKMLTPNVLIPYMDEDGCVQSIRPHRDFFQGANLTVYRTESSYKKSAACIIAESEFKADAAECFGYAAIGIPGIWSMGKSNWDYFTTVLDSINTDEFLVCFDNEVKDNPEFSNFKPDWRKRYDTILCAYALAIKILDIGRNCKVASLPDDWRVDGKVDIDNALAQGRSIADFSQAMLQALAPKKYIKVAPIPEQHRPWINKRIRQFFNKTQIQLTNHCYWTKEKINKDGEKEAGKKISNCSIEIRNMYEMIDSQGEGVKRDVVIHDEYGMESRLIPIKSNNMATKASFTQWLMGQGNYLFYGTDKDVTSVWEYIFNNDESNIVFLLNKCGYIPEHNFWIFKNVIIKQGKSYFADDSGICWVDDVGYQIRTLNENTTLPSIATEPLKFDMDTYLQYLHETVDAEQLGMSRAILAWMLAVAFSEDIFKEFYMFPILNIYGNKGGGKSTVMRWLTSLYGQEAATKNLMHSTPVGVSRSLAYYSSLPFVAEDWRDDPRCKNYIPLFLGVYNRQAGAKGIKNPFGLQEVDVKAALAILGEEMINDNGLASRCVTFYMPEERIVERFEDMEDIVSECSSFMYNILLNYDDYKKKVIANIKKEAKKLNDIVAKSERRTMFNYAILLGVWNTLMPDDKDFTDYIVGIVTTQSKDLKTGDKIHQFGSEFLFGVTEGLLQNYHYKFMNDGKTIVLWVSGICDIMNKYYNRNTRQAKLVMKHMSQQPYFVRGLLATYRGARGKLPSVELDLTKMPETLRPFFEGAYDSTGIPVTEVSDKTSEEN